MRYFLFKTAAFSSFHTWVYIRSLYRFHRTSVASFLSGTYISSRSLFETNYYVIDIFTSNCTVLDAESNLGSLRIFIVRARTVRTACFYTFNVVVTVTRLILTLFSFYVVSNGDFRFSFFFFQILSLSRSRSNLNRTQISAF